MEFITKQSKLTKTEWEGIEVPHSSDEINILRLISAGFSDVNINRNHAKTLLLYMKIKNTPYIDLYLYKQYFETALLAIYSNSNYAISILPAAAQASAQAPVAAAHLKKADIIRIENTSKHIAEYKEDIFEYILLGLVEKMLEKRFHKKYRDSQNYSEWAFYYYTIHRLLQYNVEGINAEFKRNILYILSQIDAGINKPILMKTIVEKSVNIIEKNEYLLKYADETLYDHQKQLFTVCKQPNPKLVLYIAPTGTGKTMSPIGLTEKYRVIFVCAARHVGLALAKAAISIHKKIAFAFGCNDADDIRLHYFAAKDYTQNAKSGGIGKVDNTNGINVEMMISDVQSYLPAMLYMLAFNPKEKIITYWDEPTITMDYATHDLHAVIHKNWVENLIPNVVLSSATLPQQKEIADTITDFCARFEEVDVHEIVSYDCKKTIPLINREGFVEMPHYLFSDYSQLQASVEHCKQNKTLLRYIDLGEAVRFILLVEAQAQAHTAAQAQAQAIVSSSVTKNAKYTIPSYFTDLKDITMSAIKIFYLELLANINPDCWNELNVQIQQTRHKLQESNVNIVTTDAHTLTDGPTIFLANDVNKIAQFYIQSAKIPEHVTREIMDKIQLNRTITEQMLILEKDLEDCIKSEDGNCGGSSGNSNKKNKGSSDKNDDKLSPERKEMKQKLYLLQSTIKTVILNPMFVPNTRDHLYKYALRFNPGQNTDAFTCDISEDIVVQIMQIPDIMDYWKLLLLMGIGVFAAHNSVRYTELMKKLAQEQKLFMIIAASDYIYGTNYQFCHGYIGKDLDGMSQEKCIQAMGRVGRNKIQQNYTVRFRDNSLIYKLFQHEANKPEVVSMNRLFNSSE